MRSRTKLRQVAVPLNRREERVDVLPGGGPNRTDQLRLRLQQRLLEDGPPACIVEEQGAIVYQNAGFDRIKRALAAKGALPQPEVDGLAFDESTRIAIKIDRRPVHFHLHRLPLEEGGGGAIAYIYDPISAEQNAQSKVSELNTRLEDVTRLVSDWVWETDREFAFTFVSARVTEVLGYHPRELEGRRLDTLMTRVPGDFDMLVMSGARSPFRDIEVSITHKLGEERVFRLSGLPVYDPDDGSFVGLRGTAEDVTELRGRESALIEAKESAELANRAKTEFLANMSHELRTPLNAVIGFSEIMEQEILGPLGNDQYKSYAGDIHSSAQHLLKLINDILDIAKIEAGSHQLAEEEFRPEAVIESVDRLIAERCIKANQRFSVVLPEKLPNLFGDERKIKQVLLNLLANAHKFTPEGGEIRVEAGLEEDGGFAFRVIDNGIGISPEDMAKAFAPFEQIDSRLARQYEGTGLGLPLSRGFMRLHGGDLHLESQLNAGTTATALLPAARVVT